VAAQGGSGLPGVKYPNLFVVFLVPARGVANDTVRDAMRPELEKLKAEEVTDEELARFKTRAKADLIRSLNSNEGLAEQLVTYHTLFGDWRELFRYVDRMEKVTKADIKRVAASLFVEQNRTVGRIETNAPAARPAADSKGATR
jgi:predicted Zn-dependent peptidase